MTETTSRPTRAAESVTEFAERARSWLAANMQRVGEGSDVAFHRDDDASWQLARALQRTLYDGGFAGICFPREYGGQGLGYDYQKAFDKESDGYQLPLIL